MLIILQLFLGWIYGHLAEYFLHKYLHNVNSLGFKTHFGEHHKAARKNLMIDRKYRYLKNPFTDFEYRWILIYFPLIHSPILYFFPWFYLALILSLISYLAIHIRCHQDHEWARKVCPWHYDHHMAPNQHANWGVRMPLFDYIFGTRKKWVGTKKEIITYLLKLRIGKAIEEYKNETGPYCDQR